MPDEVLARWTPGTGEAGYWSLTPPVKWQAGRSGDDPFYFDCADCGAKEPPIAGILATAREDGQAPGSSKSC